MQYIKCQKIEYSLWRPTPCHYWRVSCPLQLKIKHADLRFATCPWFSRAHATTATVLPHMLPLLPQLTCAVSIFSAIVACHNGHYGLSRPFSLRFLPSWLLVLSRRLLFSSSVIMAYHNCHNCPVPHQILLHPLHQTHRSCWSSPAHLFSAIVACHNCPSRPL